MKTPEEPVYQPKHLADFLFAVWSLTMLTVGFILGAILL